MTNPTTPCIKLTQPRLLYACSLATAKPSLRPSTLGVHIHPADEGVILLATNGHVMVYAHDKNAQVATSIPNGSVCVSPIKKWPLKSKFASTNEILVYEKQMVLNDANGLDGQSCHIEPYTSIEGVANWERILKDHLVDSSDEGHWIQLAQDYVKLTCEIAEQAREVYGAAKSHFPIHIRFAEHKKAIAVRFGKCESIGMILMQINEDNPKHPLPEFLQPTIEKEKSV